MTAKGSQAQQAPMGVSGRQCAMGKERVEEGQPALGGSRRGGMRWCMCLCLRPSRVAQEGHELCTVWSTLGGSTPGCSLATSPVRAVESLPAQHSSERIRRSVADGSLGKISPLLLLVIMSGLSMGDGKHGDGGGMLWP